VTLKEVTQTTIYSSSSQEELPPGRRRRTPTTEEDDLRDTRFDPLEFEGSLNPDHYLEWIQTLERFFDIKEYLMKRDFKVAILKHKKYASLWDENTKRQRANEGRCASKLGQIKEIHA